MSADPCEAQERELREAIEDVERWVEGGMEAVIAKPLEKVISSLPLSAEQDPDKVDARRRSELAKERFAKAQKDFDDCKRKNGKARSRAASR